MLIEQAFFHLPEILHASGYQPQEYEGGIVGAFSLALLQALNGRNTPNPIACMQVEKRFRPNGVYEFLAQPRHLRADLYLDTTKLWVASRRLAQYGWRYFNWIEAKFLRGQAGQADSHCSNKTNYVAGHLADLIRLVALVPEDLAKKSASGRYFLHVYDAPPKFYLTFNRREWCRVICEPGAHQLFIDDLDGETPRIRTLVGQLPGLQLAIALTNFVIEPSDASHLPAYWCILTRLDAIALRRNDSVFTIGFDRQIDATSPQAMDEIAGFVAERLHVSAKSPETKPPPAVEPSDPFALLRDNTSAKEFIALFE